MLLFLGIVACEVVAFAIPAWLAQRSDEGSGCALVLWPVLALALPLLLIWAVN